MTVATPLMTTEQLLAMPDDGKERWLINGELREAGMTRRSMGHSWIESRLAQKLWNWCDSQPPPRGVVLSGEAGVRLKKDPDTTVGVDVAYVSGEVVAANPADDPYVDGIPILAVEILSPSDKHEVVAEKIRGYLEAGVKRIWIADPEFRTITVHRPDAEPQLFNVNEALENDPVLPGLSIPLKEIFNR